MQSDVISRSKLSHSLKRQPCKLIDGKHYIRLDAVLEKVQIAPSVETVPEASGQWLRENIRPKSYLRVCSVCKKTAYFCGEGCSYIFCPYCRTPMDAKDTNVLTGDGGEKIESC